jgi:hypothetical protein
VVKGAIFYMNEKSNVCCKPPINVLYKRTFGTPDQGQMLDM